MSTLDGERLPSRGGSFKSLRRRYTIDASGEDEPEEYVLQWLEENAPASIAGLIPDGTGSIDENGEIEDLYEVEIGYGQIPEPAAPPSTGEVEYRFNFQAQGAHVYFSRETLLFCTENGCSAFASDVEAQDFKGAINVVSDAGKLRCEGMQIDPPAETFSLAYYPENAVVTSGYQEIVEGLCGKVNESTFRGKPAGSIMLVRVSGGVRTGEDWQIEFGFGYVPNDTEIPVGPDIVVDEKDGLDLLWAFTTEAVVEGVLIKKPIAAYVERVWPRGDFSALALP
jgi:hypothetical protein